MNVQPRIESRSAGAASNRAAPANRRRVTWHFVIPLVGYHLIAALALLPWFFSWTGVALAVFGYFVIGALGISFCYHRLLTHRAFACPKWLERGAAILAVCCAQDTPVRWVATHRWHHEHADDELDVHSPVKSFFWGHMGWLLIQNPDRHHMYDNYAKDLIRDPFYAAFENSLLYVWVNFASWLVFFGAGFAAELALGGTWSTATQFGLSCLVWGVFVRTVVQWHATWAVNSVTHRYGYRNYETDEDSRNHLVLGYLANGEGWHNNHHADQRSARFGHRWWEIDTTYAVIRLLEMLGLATRVARPAAKLSKARAAHTPLATRGPVER
jgi:stearoyl-CoA desaturase (delta-9 desaturase)